MSQCRVPMCTGCKQRCGRNSLWNSSSHKCSIHCRTLLYFTNCKLCLRPLA